MQKNKADVIFIQETHFRNDSIPKLTNRYYPMTYHATDQTSKSKGVSILIAQHCPFQLLDTRSDKEGRYLFLKGTCHGKMITLANTYAPNSQQVPFFRAISRTISTFQEGIPILGGDFNVSLNPLQDTSNGASTLPYSALLAIKSPLRDLLLYDSWWTLNPNGRDFTFFSNPHQRYSRFDYLFISQRDLPMLHQASIDPMFLSAHNPISISLTFSGIPTLLPPWRLDPSLLTGPTIFVDIELHLKWYFL